eukprot:TRINITY_DN29914_c0_g1_i2.p1 TRINITY_DN29914_c0_g1~~TRINITY_DN29914_c0_g1_i2.p1  ORF type:complete len:123 (+),score=28.86 TRINITY_DN29914_c0_g1_i2:131-499(+)
MIRRPPRSTLSSSSAASDVYKRQAWTGPDGKEHRSAFDSAYISQISQVPPPGPAGMLSWVWGSAKMYLKLQILRKAHEVVGRTGLQGRDSLLVLGALPLAWSVGKQLVERSSRAQARKKKTK